MGINLSLYFAKYFDDNKVKNDKVTIYPNKSDYSANILVIHG